MNFLTAEQAAAFLKMSRRTFYRRIEKGEIPKGVPLFRGMVGWTEEMLTPYLKK